MDFTELIGLYKNQSEDAPLPADFADQLETAYNAEIEPREAKITELTETATTLDSKVKEYAVANYDLMKSQPITPPNGVVSTPETPKPIGVDELLKKAGY